jgi:hypothetical protein
MPVTPFGDHVQHRALMYAPAAPFLALADVSGEIECHERFECARLADHPRFAVKV